MQSSLDTMILHTDSRDPDQTEWMFRLIRVFPDFTCQLVPYAELGLNFDLILFFQDVSQLVMQVNTEATTVHATAPTTIYQEE